MLAPTARLSSSITLHEKAASGGLSAEQCQSARHAPVKDACNRQIRQEDVGLGDLQPIAGHRLQEALHQGQHGPMRDDSSLQPRTILVSSLLDAQGQACCIQLLAAVQTWAAPAKLSLPAAS